MIEAMCDNEQIRVGVWEIHIHYSGYQLVYTIEKLKNRISNLL